MCGIVGLVGDQDPLQIERMNDSIACRGPDDSGVFMEPRVSVAMRRLAIIDQAGGHQPMCSVDERFVLVYNGEIFNASELRRDLEQRGSVFRSDHSDTEVLLELLRLDGESALGRLNGMFAFAFLDRQQQTLLCARDRFGIKPFYYASRGDRFAFASELKALRHLHWITREPDLQALFHYFSLNYIPGSASGFVGVESLLPGHFLRLDLRTFEIQVRRWWEPAFGSVTEPVRDVAERLAEVLGKAVDRWSISDVPVGCLLSGGLDSSAIVSMLVARGHRLQTFTVGFSGEGEAAWDELHLARQIAQKCGTDHHEIVLNPEALLDDLIDMVWALDEPYGGGLPSWSVFKAMGTEIKVAMTGTGGDEIFGNYNKYLCLEGRFRSRVPGLRRRRADTEAFKSEFFERYYYAPDREKRNDILTERFAGVSDTSELLWGHFSAGPRERTLRDRVVATDLATQLPDEFLMMTDRFSMAHSIEARTPYLDNELADAVYAVDAATRLNPREYKPLLRRIVAEMLPPDLMKAPKRGFVIPLRLWLRGRLEPLLRRLTAPARLREQGLVRVDFFARYAAPHVAGVADHTERLWNMLMFQLWWDVHVERRPLDELRAEIRRR